MIPSRVPQRQFSNCQRVLRSLSSRLEMYRKRREAKPRGSCSSNLPKVCLRFPKCLFASLYLPSVCLWGNSTDLSLLINMTEEQIKSLQSTGGDHLAATEKNILGNHLNQLWETVKIMRDKTGGRVDFVLDNAGFELYCDCVYGVDLSRLFWGGIV